MADKILHKRSSTPSAVPSAASLELGELALNTADGRAFMKKSNGAVVEIGSNGSAFFSLVTVTATSAGQTSFTIPGGYTPGAVVVFLNGSSLAAAHYTATNGTAIVLASGADVVAGTELVVLRLSAFQVADALPLAGTAADSAQLGGIVASEFYRRSNILGAVSQSGDVPTGAIVEYISNANGEAWRFAGGAQICRLSGLPVSFVSSGRIEGTWNFPAQFAANDYGIGIALLGSLDFAKCVGLPNTANRNTTSVICGFRSPSGTFATGDATTLAVTAHGRWYI